MRVTDKMIFERARAHVSAAQEQSQAATVQAATGRRFVHPGEAPASAGLVVAHQTVADRMGSLTEVTGRASDELAAADAALDGTNAAITRARELAIQMSNSTYPASERASTAREVEGLLQQVVALLNTRVGNRYVFGGMLDDAPPFDDAGDYHGDDQVRQVEIAPGVLGEASVRADQAVKGAGGGVDVLQTLRDLADALAANDEDGIRASLPSLDLATVQISGARASSGIMMNAFDTANAAARTAHDAARRSLSQESDADAVEAASQLALAQRALDAALTASAKSFELTLLKKLG